MYMKACYCILLNIAHVQCTMYMYMGRRLFKYCTCNKTACHVKEGILSTQLADYGPKNNQTPRFAHFFTIASISHARGSLVL